MPTALEVGCQCALDPSVSIVSASALPRVNGRPCLVKPEVTSETTSFSFNKNLKRVGRRVELMRVLLESSDGCTAHSRQQAAGGDVGQRNHSHV